MSLPGLDVTEIVRNTAGKYLGGDVSNLSKDELESKVKTLASTQPDKANQLLTEVGDQIDQQSGGSFAGQTDKLQDMIKKQLGM